MFFTKTKILPQNRPATYKQITTGRWNWAVRIRLVHTDQIREQKWAAKQTKEQTNKQKNQEGYARGGTEKGVHGEKKRN